MSEMERNFSEDASLKEKSVRWPAHCIWPKPVIDFEFPKQDPHYDGEVLDQAAADLAEIFFYYEAEAEKGILDETYRLRVPEEEVYRDADGRWIPEKGTEYWDGSAFDVERWTWDFSVHMNQLKIRDTSCVKEIEEILGYRFINQNLLRQAFTRRAFQIEYRLTGCNEELEFLGDSVLSMMTAKEVIQYGSSVKSIHTDAPFQSRYDEGAYSTLKNRFVCKEYLAERCRALKLDRYILYGTGEKVTDSALEDAMEALIGAVTIDCGWKMDRVGDVVSQMLELQVNDFHTGSGKSFYDLVNAWHKRHFGCMPVYKVTANQNRKALTECSCLCELIYRLPGEEGTEDPDPQRVMVSAGSGSEAREKAAKLMYDRLTEAGKWKDLKELKLVPDPERSVNQLQEMYQKGYIHKPAYMFEERTRGWYCRTESGDVCGEAYGASKSRAKSLAAYITVIRLFRAAGCCEKEWIEKEEKCIADMKAAEERNEAGVIEAILASKPADGVRYEALVSVLNQIKEGEVITEKVLLSWLGEKLGIWDLQMNYKEIPNPASRKEDAPWHRFLTSRGLVDGWYKDKLIEEGHTVVETKTTNWRVLDYKETMADMKKLSVPENPTGPCGNFLDHIREDLKDYILERYRDKFGEAEGRKNQ